MQSRMDKYQTKDDKKYERIKKNTKLYEEVYDDMYKDTTYTNMQVIDSAKEININKLKNILDDKYDTRQYRTFKNYNLDDIDKIDKPAISRKERKSYDINEIINEAKSKRTFIEEAKEKRKYIDFANRSNSRYEKKYNEMKKEEKELEELINTMAIEKQEDTSDASDALNLLSDLKGSENTIVTNPIESSFDVENTTDTITKDIQKTLIKADKTFYTDSNMFTKNDFEDFSTLTKELSKTNKKKRIVLITLIVLILSVCTYLVLTRFVIK